MHNSNLSIFLIGVIQTYLYGILKKWLAFNVEALEEADIKAERKQNLKQGSTLMYVSMEKQKKLTMQRHSS